MKHPFPVMNYGDNPEDLLPVVQALPNFGSPPTVHLDDPMLYWGRKTYGH